MGRTTKRRVFLRRKRKKLTGVKGKRRELKKKKRVVKKVIKKTIKKVGKKK